MVGVAEQMGMDWAKLRVRDCRLDNVSCGQMEVDFFDGGIPSISNSGVAYM